nr:MAG TPA: hypothetical protein [Bacteriophage sp.]
MYIPFPDYQPLVLCLKFSYTLLLLSLSTLWCLNNNITIIVHIIPQKISLLSNTNEIISLPHCVVVFHKVLNQFIKERSLRPIRNSMFIVIHIGC